MRTLKAGALALTAILLAALGAAVQADEDEVEISLEEAPSAVQATIAEHVGDGTILEIERETENGQELYSVEFRKDGSVSEIEIAPDGTFLGAEEEDDDEGEDDDDEESMMEMADLPQAVKDAIATLVGDGEIEELSRETEGGAVIYEVAWEVGEDEQEVELTEAGVIVEEEREISAADLPEAVSAALAAQYPGATIREAEAIKVHLYEVELVVDGSVREVVVSPTGRIRGEEHEDDDHEDDDD